MDPHSLHLDTPQLLEVAATLESRIARGLTEDGGELRALPAFLRPPRAGTHGRVLAIDAGGTNLRAAVVELDAHGRAQLTAGPVQSTIPDGRDGRAVDRAAFYAAHVALVRQLDGAHGLPVGYCFSYPTASEPDGDARLIRWTKGVHVDGLEGARVGEGLVEALSAAGFAPRRVVVLNDTVASLLAAAGHTPQPARTLGLIVGTGHNLASYFDGARVTKLSPRWSGPLAVNLESGNYHPPHLTTLDDALDSASGDAGRQRLEKAVSGYYLPQLFSHARPTRPPLADGRALLAVAGDAADPDAPLAQALLDRSADLVAAALAGVARFHEGADPITVLAEGGLFHSTPRYAARVAERLATLHPGAPVVLARAADANLVGAAWAALS
jgi:hexokinase